MKLISWMQVCIGALMYVRREKERTTLELLFSYASTVRTSAASDNHILYYMYFPRSQWKAAPEHA